MTRAVLLVDIQRDYLPGGGYPLVGSDAPADAAATVLRRFREADAPVIHVQQRLGWLLRQRSSTPQRRRRARPRVAPAAREPVIVKAKPNAFLATALERRLRAHGVDELVVAGMMTSMCIDATVRAVADLGFDITLIGDGCAARELEYRGTSVPGCAAARRLPVRARARVRRCRSGGQRSVATA